MLNIDWRSPAAYAHTKHIPAAGFAWEYLRRNDEYRSNCQMLGLSIRDAKQLESLAHRWGLLFPKRPRHGG